ncbi:nucleoside transporter-domain-containing protein [Tuber indicum]|nr:nucleoside transporter-domain-containing protein [Tuber indicum]
MERLREWWKPTYEPLEDQDEWEDASSPKAQRVSRFEYFVFLSLGVAMLWSWNMFMACATYFQRRFAEGRAFVNEFLLNNFQSLILVVSTITNLGSAVYLSYRQKSANYPWRICASLVINCAVFTVLALSAVIWSAGLSQNGIFAFASKFSGIYTQAIVTGQGVAGVLPAIAQIVSVLAAPQSPGTQGSTASPKSAFIYFPTATFVSCSCLLLFLLLLSRHRISPHKSGSDVTDSEDHAPAIHTQVSLWDTSPRMFKPDNLGDLSGRVLHALVSIAWLVYIPSYTMCNIKGHGAVISSDLFYWLVQFTFEMSNGWVGSNVMMSTPGWVGDDEKEASGGFMGMSLVAGLATGSFTSFLIVNV